MHDTHPFAAITVAKARYETLTWLCAPQVLNYGQALFEGMKAQRSARGRIVLFRPDCNAARMRDGAARLSMAGPPADVFLDAVTQTVIANKDYVSGPCDNIMITLDITIMLR